MLIIKTIRPAGVLLATFTALLYFNSQAASALEKPGMNRTMLLEKKVTMPSNDLNAKVIRVTFPPAFKTPWHTHEGPGPRYVIKGTLKIDEQGKTGTYSAGEVFWETGRLMSVENVGEGAAELIIFELAPAR